MPAARKSPPVVTPVIRTGDHVIVEFMVDEVQSSDDGDVLVLKTMRHTGKTKKYPATFVVAASAVDVMKGVCTP